MDNEDDDGLTVIQSVTMGNFIKLFGEFCELKIDIKGTVKQKGKVCN